MPGLKQEFMRYLGVCGLAFAVDFTALAVLTALLGLHYLPATLLAFLLGTGVNYGLSVCWVFKYRTVQNSGLEFGLFLLVGVVTLGVSLALMAALVDGLALPVLLAKCLVTAFTLVANFAGRRVLLFSRWGRASSPVSAR
jgi:putative flippase GtrA